MKLNNIMKIRMNLNQFFYLFFLLELLEINMIKYEVEEVYEDDAKKFDYEIKGIFFSLGNFYLETLSRFY